MDIPLRIIGMPPKHVTPAPKTLTNDHIILAAMLLTRK